MKPSRPYPSLVSIIVPSYNQGQFIRQTIDSCLAQDYRPLEILVIDGASTDGTVDVLHEYDGTPEVRWVSEPDKGVAEAVNKGFALARGEIAGIQSSDDAYLPGAISQAVEHFSGSPELGLVYGDWVYVDAEGKELKRYQTGPYSLENFLCMSTLIPQHAAFFRLNLARNVGGWNAGYFVADTEMWLRMLFQAEARKVDAFWGIRRMHQEQRNTQAAKIVESWSRMVDKSLEIENAPLRLKQAAKCGKFLIAAGYNPGGKAIVRYYLYWRAFLSFPDVAKHRKIFGALFPGYWRFYRWYYRFCRGVNRVKGFAGVRQAD
jgi:glycosyltransferase involved in cell wall biosynthesis